MSDRLQRIKEIDANIADLRQRILVLIDERDTLATDAAAELGEIRRLPHPSGLRKEVKA